MCSRQNVMQMLFEFPNRDRNKQPISFHDPEEVVTADKTEEVLPALEKIQKAVQNGYYAAGYLFYEAAPAFDG
ncbi:MAG TPA: hypothetical protein VFK37_10190 [Bacillales bacterium]|nr:hypothetical protein [Bacillales bacterium]